MAEDRSGESKTGTGTGAGAEARATAERQKYESRGVEFYIKLFGWHYYAIATAEPVVLASGLTHDLARTRAMERISTL